jgi:predicted nucleic acid-binding protein
VIVDDTSPLNYLLQVEAIYLLPRLYGNVIIPGAVLAELLRDETPTVVRSRAASPPEWVTTISPSKVGPDLADLDAGEREAIALALQVGAREILIDEWIGSVRARAKGLKTIGTLGVLLEGDKAGIADGASLFEILASRTSFRLSPAVYSRFLAALESNRSAR